MFIRIDTESSLDQGGLNFLQVLDSRGDNDLSYLREVMEYALGVLVKLSAPAKEDEMKKSHEKFLSELAVLVSQSTDKRNASLTTVVRGLRFVLEQIRVCCFLAFYLSHHIYILSLYASVYHSLSLHLCLSPYLSLS